MKSIKDDSFNEGAESLDPSDKLMKPSKSVRTIKVKANSNNQSMNQQSTAMLVSSKQVQILPALTSINSGGEIILNNGKALNSNDLRLFSIYGATSVAKEIINSKFKIGASRYRSKPKKKESIGIEVEPQNSR